LKPRPSVLEANSALALAQRAGERLLAVCVRRHDTLPLDDDALGIHRTAPVQSRRPTRIPPCKTHFYRLSSDLARGRHWEIGRAPGWASPPAFRTFSATPSAFTLPNVPQPIEFTFLVRSESIRCDLEDTRMNRRELFVDLVFWTAVTE